MRRLLLSAAFLVALCDLGRAVVAVTPTAAPPSGMDCQDPSDDNLIVNGGFENGTTSGWNVTIGCCSSNPTCVLQPAVYVVTPGPENGAAGEVGTCGLMNYVACGGFAGQAFSGADWWCGTAKSWAEMSQEFHVSVPSVLKFNHAGVVQIYWNDPPEEAYCEFAVEVLPPGGSAWQPVWSREVRSLSKDIQRGLECFFSIPHYIPWSPMEVGLCTYSGWTGRVRARAYSSSIYGWVECSFAYLDDVRTESCQTIRLEVFNQAGERVRSRDLPMMAMKNVPREIRVEPDPFSPDGDGDRDVTVITLPDGQQATWDGKNDQGRVVTNGVYLLRAAVYDVRGTLNSQFVRNVTVAARGNRLTVDLCDTAGHVMKRLSEMRGPYQATDLELSENPYTPGVRDGAWQTLRVRVMGRSLATSAAGSVYALADFTWAGDDGAGNLIANGTYWIRILSTGPAGQSVDLSRSLIVLRGRNSILLSALTYPSPYRPADGPLSIAFEPAIPLAPDAEVVVFDLQGREVARKRYREAGEPDPNRGGVWRRVIWDGLTADRKLVSDGVYVAQVELADLATGIRETKRLKFAVSRKP